MPNFRIFPDLILLGISLASQAVLTLLLYRLPSIGRFASRRRFLWLLTGIDTGLFCAGYLMVFGRVSRHFPLALAAWIPGVALIWAMLIAGVCVVGVFWKAAAALVRITRNRRPPAALSRQRRRFLGVSASLLFAAPVAATAFGIIHRNKLTFAEVDIPVPDLHPDLQGLKIVQVTDVHLSAFLSESELAYAIDAANETRAHLALMTGDLITVVGDPLDACLRQLARLRAEAGVLGCLGNHEIYTGTEAYVAEQGRKIGIDFLRMRNRQLRFGGASINFAGVDYQRSHRAYLVGAGRLVVPGQLNVLLSHNPDVFRVAAKQGYNLTIAGHTHGGQVNIEILHDNFNLARYYTPYTRGLYTLDAAHVYVSAGIGTVGMPVRLGAPAEINLIRLVRSA